MVCMRFRYVGPPELAIAGAPRGHRIGSAEDFGRWVAARSVEELAEPFTFVVDIDGWLRLAPRRSEHVACAGGWWPRSATSQRGTASTSAHGAAAAWAFDRAGLHRLDEFTHPVVSRLPGGRSLLSGCLG